MPAAAVIPAPIAYIKVVAVKKLVVGFLAWCAWPTAARCVSADVRLPSFWTERRWPARVRRRAPDHLL